MRKLTVFVSSAWLDLQSEQEAVEHMLRRMQESGFAELQVFAVRPDTPKEVRLAALNHSDLYIGLFARYYGAIDPESGVSLTELEYRRARQRGIPRLVYLKDDEVPARKEHTESDPDRVARLAALKRELRQEPRVHSFMTAESLAARITMDIQNVLKSEPESSASKYEVTIIGSQGVVVGDHAQVTQHLGRSQVSQMPLATAAAAIQPQPAELTCPPQMKASAWIRLGDQDYFIQAVLAERAYNAYVVRLGKVWGKILARNVLLKQIEPLRDDRETRRALRKAKADARTLEAAAGKCSHLPHVFDVHDAEGTLWVVMEWIQGNSLSQLYPADGPLPDADIVDRILRHALDVCDALTALHGKGLSHLNVTPDNVVHARGRRGSVLVDLTLTEDPRKGISGTPGFRAPEQARSRPAKVFPGPATDIYGLGATLYFLLTHRLPSVARGSPCPTPSDINPAVPPILDEVLLKALAPHPNGRFARPRDLKRVLQSVQRKMRYAEASGEEPSTRKSGL